MHRNNILEGYNYGFYEPSTLETGTHICSLYDSDEDFLKNLTAFIVDGLKNNEAVAYVGIPESLASACGGVQRILLDACAL